MGLQEIMFEFTGNFGLSLQGLWVELTGMSGLVWLWLWLWLLLAPPGSWRSGSSWLLLALAPPGSSWFWLWLLLASPPGSSWLLLALPGSSLAPPGSQLRLPGRVLTDLQLKLAGLRPIKTTWSLASS